MAQDPLSRVFAALADPTRRDILMRLRDGARSVGDLAEPYDMSMPAVSKHLRVLEAAGLIERRRDAQRRESVLRPDALAPAADWVQAAALVWQNRLDRLETHLRASANSATPVVSKGPPS